MKITRMFNGPLLDFFAGNPDVRPLRDEEWDDLMLVTGSD